VNGKKEEDTEKVESPVSESHSEPEDTPRKARLQKSPLLTAHRLSTSSLDLDDVNLAGSKEDELSQPNSPEQESKPSSPSVPSGESDSKRNSRQGVSANPAPKDPPPAAQPPPPTRKLTSPFSWLTRSSTSNKEVKSSPPQSAGSNRRNTGASVASNPDAALGRLQEGDEDNLSTASKKTGRSSLKDQFRLLRMRDESHVSDADQASVASGRGSVGHGLASPTGNQEEKEDGPIISPPASAATPTVNPNLAPGTVSGISASATDAAAPVDWELWQQLVNHGPEALKGAKAGELNAAIKRGIPQTIRGVIWQVLADSRNPELEEVYRELVARGTDKEKKDRHSSMNGSVNGNLHDKEKDSLSSSRSSLRSDFSVTLTQSNTGTSSPSSQEKDPEKLAKEQAAAEAARKKKAKEEAAAIQKLERTIRKDLGSRTSYSKYFISQGCQEALFGVCKAYALYDEAVGYAQGMSFIVMPLLFNVSIVHGPSKDRVANAIGN